MCVNVGTPHFVLAILSDSPSLSLKHICIHNDQVHLTTLALGLWCSWRDRPLTSLTDCTPPPPPPPPPSVASPIASSIFPSHPRPSSSRLNLTIISTWCEVRLGRRRNGPLCLENVMFCSIFKKPSYKFPTVKVERPNAKTVFSN